jgi:hypothetical protein
VYWRQLISRRTLLSRAGHFAWPLVLSAGTSLAAQDSDDGGQRSLPLLKVIKNAQVLDISPDGKKICLYCSPNPTRSFRVTGTAWRENKSPVRETEDALRIIDFGSGTQIYAMRLPAVPFCASFLGDGMSFYVGIPGVTEGAKSGDVHLIVSLKDNQVVEHFAPFSSSGLLFFYTALKDRKLLGTGKNPTPNRTEVLTLVESPNFTEVARATFCDNRIPGTAKSETPIAVSGDRTCLCYGVDDKVLLRSTADLSVIWTAKMIPNLQLWQVAVSKQFVAASANDGYTGDGPPPKRVGQGYISLFDVASGREKTRVFADATESLALSPNGQLIAAGQRLFMPGKESGTQPTVLLFDVSSGKRIATIIHDQFREGGAEFLHAGVRVRFSPDGRYLITSGLNTKVWDLSE